MTPPPGKRPFHRSGPPRGPRPGGRGPGRPDGPPSRGPRPGGGSRPYDKPGSGGSTGGPRKPYGRSSDSPGAEGKPYDRPRPYAKRDDSRGSYSSARSGPPRSGSGRDGPPRGFGKPSQRAKIARYDEARDGGPTGPLGPGVRILHEDEDLIVVDKPPGLLTVDASEEGRDNLTFRLRTYLKDNQPRLSRSRQKDLEAAGKASTLPGPLPGVIHRLDREASGLLVFSKSRRAHPWLKDDFKQKRVHRMYIAVVEGVVGKAGDAGTIQTFIRENERGQVMVEPLDKYSGPIAGRADSGDDAARLAVTHYRVVATGQGRTLLQVRLATGRKNQIRAHMAHKGFPILGDERFGARTNPVKRLALHATELGFTHPGNGQTVRFNSPAPPSFYAAVDAPVPTPAEVAHAQRLRPTPVPAPGAKPADTSWNNVAKWYDSMHESGGSDHYQNVIIPGTLRMVGPHEGMRVLDVACGQGIVSRAMGSLGAKVVGVDAATDLITAAKKHGGGSFLVGDATRLGELDLEPGFNVAVSVMALGNIEPLEPVFEGVSSLLAPDGALVIVISHPAFRAPGQTSWGWDDASGAGKQYRRVDGYLSPGQHRISMHPGDAPDVSTWTFHRPIQAYVKALAAAGFVVENLEEWAGQRQSQPGPRAAEENRARREIPLFLAIRAVKRSD